MRVLKVEAETGKSEILVGESLGQLGKYCSGGGKTVIITDKKVRGLYGNSFPEAEVIEIGQGEESKTLKTVEEVYGKLVGMEADRSSCIVGVGGGIVCDVAGFIASTYMRGVRFGFVPTTLLAQVDASIGGKNGVNFGGYKNLVGTFSQPEFVICDFGVLKTLDRRQLSCGFAEAVKHAAVASPELFSYIEENAESAFSLHRTAIEKVVYECLVIKAGVVSADEKEKGERRKLNFGHTIGHGVEKTLGLLHGEAVSVGMAAAARLSVKRGLLSEEDAGRVEKLLGKLGLPTKVDMDRGAILDAMRRDKKREGDKLKFVLLNGIGNAIIEEIGIDDLEVVMDDLCMR